MGTESVPENGYTGQPQCAWCQKLWTDRLECAAGACRIRLWQECPDKRTTKQSGPRRTEHVFGPFFINLPCLVRVEQAVGEIWRKPEKYATCALLVRLVGHVGGHLWRLGLSQNHMNSQGKRPIPCFGDTTFHKGASSGRAPTCGHLWQRWRVRSRISNENGPHK